MLKANYFFPSTLYLANRITRCDTNQGSWQCPPSSSNKSQLKVCPHIAGTNARALFSVEVNI
nr:MAG TPA: hypothetical protein [Caudoviricetes sp.]